MTVITASKPRTARETATRRRIDRDCTIAFHGVLTALSGVEERRHALARFTSLIEAASLDNFGLHNTRTLFVRLGNIDPCASTAERREKAEREFALARHASLDSCDAAGQRQTS